MSKLSLFDRFNIFEDTAELAKVKFFCTYSNYIFEII